MCVTPQIYNTPLRSQPSPGHNHNVKSICLKKYFVKLRDIVVHVVGAIVRPGTPNRTSPCGQHDARTITDLSGMLPNKF